MGFLKEHPVATAAIVLFTVWFTKFVVATVKHRKRFRNLPGPPHHPVFGHLISIGKVTAKLPKLVHPHVFAHYLRKEYDLPPVFYVDFHPVSQSMLMVVDPELSYEISANSGLPKHQGYHDHLAPIIGPTNLLLSEGGHWKKQRSVFNPGFAIGHIYQQVPTIVDIAEKFVHVLEGHAKQNKIFRLEEELTKTTIDIIGKVVIDHDFNTLTTQNDFLDAMRGALSWIPDTQSLNPFHTYHPLRPFFWKYYKSRMNRYIGNVLDERFKVRDANLPKKARKKSSIDLALEEYFKESGHDVDSRTATMDAEFRQSAIDNMLTLLFAGHDTTSSTICYCYHMLSKHPEEFAKLRAELDDVFGTGVHAAEKLKADPYLINKCEYLSAVIKEVLRLWSPASTVRTGKKGYFLKDPVTGEMLPTEDIAVWPVLITMHRDTRLWGEDANNFNPSRFLPSATDSHIPNSYRPFEKGPRNCIGQELANVEMKIILALTLREFDIKAAFNELDKIANDGSMWSKGMISKSGPQECYGDEMYQVLMGSAKPREGMPARASKREM